MEKFAILIVDDIEENIYSLRLLIEESFDVNIFTALNAKEAIKILVENNIDLILTDIQMPDIDGFEFAQYIKGIDSIKHIPIIFITGIYDKDEYKSKGYDVGGVEYITKPIDKHLLTSKLKIYIDIYNKIKATTEKLNETQDLLIQNSRIASMGEMVGLISHQLKQPLNVLSMYCDDVNMSYDFNELDEEHMKRFSDNTKKQINYMDATINGFLNFFKPNKKKEEFLLKNCIVKTEEILKNKIKVYSANINLDLDEDLKIFGVETELLQLIINIVNNSLDEFKERDIKEPEIFISAHKENDKTVLILEDNAGGVEKENLDRILEPYFTTKENGTGIGLYLVKIIVENSFEGKLEVVNADKGLKFIIIL
ncbi:MAG: response regulator [Arcobacter sp.]|jgi:C4-dicarboxylate-specific signal transduction histidine kinase|uniref:histidine kinase n=1 Tax=Arcobacter defluvii TaxID=873191 RepID=A0AAE7BEP3_9BACT|nr:MULTISPECIES: response regulator [Arcobacter]MDY3199761.1 response regulator [Arcobacter sp.]QKF77713.1 two-component system sensor histidine kinase/response regulator fusion protein [Arcobacter defluvii]RXI34315.1 hybrid sensor histidine kinase/response regulator [Arcobacter defluvii]BAK73514.1 two-component sensor kinase [Arcobacter sp. L]